MGIYHYGNTSRRFGSDRHHTVRVTVQLQKLPVKFTVGLIVLLLLGLNVWQTKSLCDY